MNNWFECKVRYEKMMENGIQKMVTEPYLVDALSFTEAEARIIKEITPYISGEFTISDIKRAKYTELFEDPAGDKWYRCKIFFITLDEKSGAEKRTACSMLVQAADLATSLQNLIEGMKGTMADYQIAAITETAIMDVYPYIAENEKPATAFANPNQEEEAEIQTLLSEDNGLDENESIIENELENTAEQYPS